MRLFSNHPNFIYLVISQLSAQKEMDSGSSSSTRFGSEKSDGEKISTEIFGTFGPSLDRPCGLMTINHGERNAERRVTLGGVVRTKW